MIRAFRKRYVAGAVATGTLMIAACSNHGSALLPALNPDAVAKVHLTASIKNAPGAFDRVEAKASYEVENRDCVPLTSISGVRRIPNYTITLPMTESDGAYHTTISKDALVDADYFRNGVCHWHLISISAIAVRKNRRFEASVTPSTSGDASSSSPYFSIESYEDSSEALVDTGLLDASEITQPDKAFQIEVTAREAK